MTINLSLPQKESEIKPRITVIGVGGAGGNAVNNMISAALEGVEFIVANTDAQALGQSLADRRVQLGITITQGLGAGARPEVGRQAAEEALPEILQLLDGANMVFVTAGMGGGTGTGAAPVIAAAAREQGILTIGVVTKPFHFEGRRRMQSAEQGITELEKVVDTLIVIPNQNLFKIANEKTTFADAFKMADDVLHMGVRGVTDLMVMPGLINLDFADIRTVMGEMGKAMMGTGEAEGQDRSRVAAESAISNPLLEDHSMKGAKGVLINITGGLDMTLHEVDEAANRIREEVDADANIIFGSTFDATMQGRMRVSVVSTGISAMAAQQPAAELRDARHEPADADRPAGAQPFGRAAGRPRRHAGRGGCARRSRTGGTAGRAHGRRRSAGDGARRSPRTGRCRAHRAGTGGTADPGDGRDADPGPDRRSAGRAGARTGPCCRSGAGRTGDACRSADRGNGSARSGRAGCGPAAPAGRRERLARQPSGGQAGGAGQRADRATGCRAGSQREPRAEPVPAHHRRVCRTQAGSGSGRRAGGAADSAGKCRGSGPQSRPAAGPGAGLDQSRRHRARQARAR